MAYPDHRSITARPAALAAACLLASLLTGCGPYSATSGRIDDNLRRVSVPYLENRTAEPDIGIQLTELIIAALRSDNTLKVVDAASADTEIAGAVLVYKRQEAFTTGELLVDEYQVQIMVELDFTELGTGEKIFAKKRIRGTGNYVLDDPDGSTEETAREEAAAEIVRDVVASVVEDW